MMAAEVFINGKFAAQPMTGVQRVASQLLLALDASAEPLPGRWTVLCPLGSRPPALKRMQCVEVGTGDQPLHLWEQWTLPRAARHGLLVNLAGSAPWAARRQVCMIHDAAVFDQPQAYGLAFGLWYRALFRHVARSPATLLTTSAFSRQRLALALRLAKERIAVVGNGGDHLQSVVPDDSLLAHPQLRGRPFFLAVGSDNPNKNHARLIAAYAAHTQGAADPPVRLLLVGGRNNKVFAGKAEVPDPAGVCRAGQQSDAVLKSLYQHALALVFPSLYEGFGIPPLEAMAEGCPVIAARSASLPEVCGDAALYVDPLDVAELQSSLHRMQSDESLRQQLRSAGLAHVRRHSWASCAQALLGALPPTHCV